MKITNEMIKAFRDGIRSLKRNLFTIPSDEEIIAGLKAALAAAPQPNGDVWQPIETAPKDGTSILVSDGNKVTLAWWSLNSPFGDDGLFTEIEVWDNEEECGVAEPLGFQPNYWIPLPPHPQQRKEVSDE